MKKFNSTISIEIEVDAIANKMLSTMEESNPHKEMITETIITSMVMSGHIGLLYNNLNGWTNELDFKEGQLVSAKTNTYDYSIVSKAEEAMDIKMKDYEIGLATVVQIDIKRSSEKIRVSFDGIDSKGNPEKKYKWVNHKKLTTI